MSAGGLYMGLTGRAPASVPALDCPATYRIGRADMGPGIEGWQHPEVLARIWLAESTRLRQRYPGLRLRVAAETATDVCVVAHQRRGAVRAILWFERLPESRSKTSWYLTRDVTC